MGQGRLRFSVLACIFLAMVLEVGANNAEPAIGRVWSQAISVLSVILLISPAAYLILHFPNSRLLRGTAVVGAATLILSEIMQLTELIQFLNYVPFFGVETLWHNTLQWSLLLAGLVLMLATLYISLLDMIATQEKLARESAALSQQVEERRQIQTALDRRVQQQEAVNLLSQCALANPDCEDIFDEATRLISTTLGIRSAAIFSFEYPSGNLAPRAGSCPTGSSKTPAAPTDVIIQGDNKAFGLLRVELEENHYLSQEELGFLRAMGNIVAVSVEREETGLALRRNEKYFRALIENGLDLITVLNSDGTIRYESPSIERVLGYSQDELTGVRIFTLIHPDDVPRALESFKTGMDNPGKTPAMTIRIRHKDGSYRTLEAIGRGLFDEPAVNGAIINSRDITERVQLEHQLLQAQKMEGIGRLAGGVAHDFNNLLTAMLGYADITMMLLPEGTRARDNVSQIREAATRATDLTRQLLSFARKQMIEPRVINLSQLVLNTEKMIRRLISEDIALTTAIEAHQSLVRLDPSQFEQVLINLVINARDAMPDGGKLNIEVQDVMLSSSYARQHPSVLSGDYVMLAVTDTGIGMEAEVRERIFEPFFTTKGVGKGTGLGLAMCYGVVKQAEGHIWVYSEPGQGTTFKIYLPRAAGPEPTPGPAPVEYRTGGHETILLVEDEPLVLLIASEALREAGYKVLTANSGPEALRMAEAFEGHIDLLLTDVVMPELGGRQVAERLLEQRPDTRVLYMSGYTDDAIVRHGVLEQGVAFLSKPFTPDGLARKVRIVLDSE